jgi:hypothetical protein
MPNAITWTEDEIRALWRLYDVLGAALDWSLCFSLGSVNFCGNYLAARGTSDDFCFLIAFLWDAFHLIALGGYL